MQTTPKGQRFLPADDHLAEYEDGVYVIAQRRVIRILFARSTPISVSNLINQAKISINALGAIYLKLNDAGYIELSDIGLTLTTRGRLWAVKSRKEIFMHERKIEYRVPPQLVDVSGERLNGCTKLPKIYLLSQVDADRISR